MFNSVSDSYLMENRLLSGLPVKDLHDIQDHFEPVMLAKGQILDGQNGGASEFAYFPVDSVISLVSPLEDEHFELAMVGRDGATGVYNALGFNSLQYKPVVQIPGEALRIKSDALRRQFEQNAALSILLMQYLHALYAQIAQVAVCYRRHKIQQRLQTWLMMMFNRVEGEELRLRQDEIADSLGYQRPTISNATAALAKQNIIRYSRGHIWLLDGDSLEKSTCECYKIMESQYERISTPTLPKPSLPVGVTKTNLAEKSREYIYQLGSSIKQLREICEMNEAVYQRQQEIITGREQRAQS